MFKQFDYLHEKQTVSDRIVSDYKMCSTTFSKKKKKKRIKTNVGRPLNYLYIFHCRLCTCRTEPERFVVFINDFDYNVTLNKRSTTTKKYKYFSVCAIKHSLFNSKYEIHTA